MADPLTSLSQSSLQDYTDCPRRFQLRYLEQLTWPAVESEPLQEHERRQQEGWLFHLMVCQHLLGLPADKVGRQAISPDLRRWWENYLADDTLQRLRASAKLYPEITLSATLGQFRLIAQYDLIAVGPEGILVYDWKTYHRRPRNDWLARRWQTRLYRALVVQAGAHLSTTYPPDPERLEMVYWFASYPADPARFPYSAAQFQRDRNALAKLVEEIAQATNFPKTEDDHICLYCSYRSYCERGTIAGEGETEEAEMLSWELDFEQIQEIAW